jgi:hypothetical protein
MSAPDATVRDRVRAEIRSAAASGAGYATAHALGVAAGLPRGTAAAMVCSVVSHGVILREARKRTDGHTEVRFVLPEEKLATAWAVISRNSGANERAERAKAERRAHYHRLRMAKLGPPSEAEARALIERHIAERGVTRFEVQHVPDPSGLPVRGRAGGGSRVTPR